MTELTAECACGTVNTGEKEENREYVAVFECEDCERMGDAVIHDDGSLGSVPGVDCRGPYFFD